jgi:hypothetical protein
MAVISLASSGEGKKAISISFAHFKKIENNLHLKICTSVVFGCPNGPNVFGL